MTDEPKPYPAVLADVAKRYGTPTIATAALALSITALATGGAESTAVTETATVSKLASEAPVAGPRKRLDITTDVEVSLGARITATGRVDHGARLVAIDSCVGHYDETTQICVLSPGSWELHSACYDRAGDEQETICEVTVRNTGTIAAKFSGYVEVATP